MKKKEANVAKAKKKTAKKAAAKKPAAKAAKKSAPKPAKKTAARPAKKPAAKSVPKSAKAKPALKAKASSSSNAGKAIRWDQFLTPLDDRVIVESLQGERMTAGGLYIPDTADVSGNFKGVVLVAGRGHRDDKGKVHPMDVQAGDTVLFSEYSGSKMTLQGREVRILRESEIMGIVEKK